MYTVTLFFQLQMVTFLPLSSMVLFLVIYNLKEENVKSISKSTYNALFTPYRGSFCCDCGHVG